MVGYKLLSMVPRDLMREIVMLVVGGKDDKVEEKMRALRPLSLASRLTQESTMGLMGYVMSLAPARNSHERIAKEDERPRICGRGRAYCEET